MERLPKWLRTVWFKAIGSEGRRQIFTCSLFKNLKLANDPIISVQVIARFLNVKRCQIKEAFIKRDLRTARRLVNGGIMDSMSSKMHRTQEMASFQIDN
jgi:hypothetical protein